MNRVQIKNALIEFFTNDDIPYVCGFIGCDYETLPAKTKDGIFRELVLWSEHHSKYNQLVQLVQTIAFFAMRMNAEEIKTMAFDLEIDDIPESSGNKRYSLIMAVLYSIQHRGQEHNFKFWLETNRPDLLK